MSSRLRERCIAEARPIPWFARVDGWTGWPGPDDAASRAVDADLEQLRETLGPEGLFPDFDDCLHAVAPVVGSNVPDWEAIDAWSGRGTAVWRGAWAVVLRCMLRHLGRAEPAWLTLQLQVFAAGHWPHSYLDPSSPPDRRQYRTL